MRHGVKKLKLGSDKDHTKSIVRNIAMALIINEKIKTTETRAAMVAPFVEKLINMGKNKDKLNAIRQIDGLLQHHDASRKIFEVLAKKYADRKSGYIRKTAIGYRKGDNAHLVLIELV